MEIQGVSSLQILQALSAFINPQTEQEDKDGETLTPSARLGPGNIGPTPKDTPVLSASVSNSKDIWSEEEVAEGSHCDDHGDTRPQPEYEVIMKQSVGAEDVFLGLSGKDPSSMSCEALLVKIKLPDTRLADVVLDINETFLDLRTPKFKLGLHLPHPVLSQEGKAQFFSEKEELEVTLLMKRPHDFINGR
ncbi:dynein axonemal assembly factor 6-like [Eucyclogobius newberryi]|uniref:dynein axonemal assembly factor 6-like n=1 Tax=Eucyclogobius newberryi TaxID=166745 RepID=UPI003B5C868F